MNKKCKLTKVIVCIYMYMSTCTYNKKSVTNKSFANLEHF